MERKLLLVFALTFLVIMLFQPLLKKYGPQPPAPKPEAAQSQNPQTPQGQLQTPAMANAATSAAAPPAPRKGAATATANKQASSESEMVIENDLYRIVFTNRGGRVKSWVLKKYTDDKNNPLELVNPAAAEKYGYPLSLWAYDESLRNKLNSALFVASSTSSHAPAEITFEYSDGDVAVQKTFKFDHSYVVQVQTSVEMKGASVTALPMWPAGFGDETSGASYALSQIAYQYDSKIERLAIKKISGGNTLPGPFHWAGLEDQYFAAVFLPQDPQTATMVTLRNTIEIPHSASDPNNKQMDKVEVLGVGVGSLKGASAVRLYVGPKALPDLESVQVPGLTGAEPDLRALVDFGWLGVIARPLFLWLKWTYSHIVPNWGWAIVIQTLIINLALLPLRLTQMKSMLKMQRVAPQIKAIQEKYKKYSLRDPRKAEMNQEVSALYKKEGVNPAGGCLPLLIQMPFLFAYYRMLGVAIDLRHAPWGWVRDLSSPDPWHLLPVAIIVTMLFMQRMTPQAGMDPTQQKMMNIMMPGMLGVISWNLAAGLCLYWSMGNLIGIVQQSVMNRTALGREMREMMEKRARKKDK
ncbi:MAG: membrane protein insertase YidC [Acidobacteriales bacterium]|nr:membrane protein insertase YidC [Terriglobales bacterium]